MTPLNIAKWLESSIDCVEVSEQQVTQQTQHTKAPTHVDKSDMNPQKGWATISTSTPSGDGYGIRISEWFGVQVMRFVCFLWDVLLQDSDKTYFGPAICNMSMEALGNDGNTRNKNIVFCRHAKSGEGDVYELEFHLVCIAIQEQLSKQGFKFPMRLISFDMDGSGDLDKHEFTMAHASPFCHHGPYRRYF